MKTLVIGASINPERYSNKAILSLLKHNHEVVALGNKSGNVSGIEIDKDLKPYMDIDTVTLYLNSTRQRDYYDYIISLNPKRVIFNPGTENAEFYKILSDHSINYEVACTLVLLASNQF